MPTSADGEDDAHDEQESIVLGSAWHSRTSGLRSRVTPRHGSGESSKASSVAASGASSAPSSSIKQGHRQVQTLDASAVQRALLKKTKKTGNQAVAPAKRKLGIGGSHAGTGAGGRTTGMGDDLAPIDEGETTTDDEGPPRAKSGSKSGSSTGETATGQSEKRISSKASHTVGKSRLAGQGTPVGPLLASSDEESLSEESDGDNAPLPAAGAARQVCRLTWGCCDFVFCMRSDIQYMKIIMYDMSTFM